jgi:hypothetical protein
MLNWIIDPLTTSFFWRQESTSVTVSTVHDVTSDIDHATTSIFIVHFLFFLCSGEFKIFSLRFIAGTAATLPTVLVIPSRVKNWKWWLLLGCWFMISQLRGCLDAKILEFGYCSIFICIWQLVSNHELIWLKRFVSWFTTKLYN